MNQQSELTEESKLDWSGGATLADWKRMYNLGLWDIAETFDVTKACICQWLKAERAGKRTFYVVDDAGEYTLLEVKVLARGRFPWL